MLTILLSMCVCVFPVRGFVRGRPLNPNQLVHVCDVGVGRMKGIWQVEDPLPFRPKSSLLNCGKAVVAAVGRGGDVNLNDSSVEEEKNRTLLAMPSTELQESLDMEAEPDPLAGEQTWPTEEEVRRHGKAERLIWLFVIFLLLLIVCICTACARVYPYYFKPIHFQIQTVLCLPDINSYCYQHSLPTQLAAAAAETSSSGGSKMTAVRKPQGWSKYQV